VLIAHVVVNDSCVQDGHPPAMLEELQRCLAGHFDVQHSMLQFEAGAHAPHEPWGQSLTHWTDAAASGAPHQRFGPEMA
jgi:hypothetical protein